MSKRKGTSYTFIFATIVCVVCSLILALSSTALQPRQKDNMKLDIVQNILISVGHTKEELTKKSSKETFALFATEFETKLIDKNNEKQNRDFMDQELINLGYPQDQVEAMNEGELLSTFQSRMSLLAAKAKKKKSDYDPGYKLVYVHKGPDPEHPDAYVIPVQGYGLWDIIKGYLALDPDLSTVKGVTFYEHKETPGLGARITEDWFKDNYVGKKILDAQGNLRSVEIARGKATDTVSGEALSHYVDGISGATLTGKGINDFILRDLQNYEPYFSTIRNQKKGTE